MAYVTSSGQVAEMARCSRPSQTDVTFVVMKAFAEKVYVEDFIANRSLTAKSKTCWLDLTFLFSCVFCFSASFLASEFALDLPR